MNFKPFIQIIALTIFLLFYSCKNNTINENEAVDKVVYRLIEADNKSDIQAVLNSYTDSVEFYPAGKEFIKGIKNVQANYENLFRQNQLSISTQINETRVFGNTAIITGINKGTRRAIADSSSVKIDDKYIAILIRNSKGEWKIDKLIWGINH